MTATRTSLAALGAAVLGLSSLATGQDVFINEFVYDNYPGADDGEYVELHNAGTTQVDISGWVLESYDENGANTFYTVAPNTVLAPGGYWVMGSSLVPAVNQGLGTSGLWENAQETLELKDTGGNLIDAVVYETNKQRFQLSSALVAECGEGIWGNMIRVAGTMSSLQRIRDGHDTGDNGADFESRPETPGATNDIGSLLPHVENFDLLTPDTDVPNWGASFVYPQAIDPTALGSANPNTIPASPQGGNAFICWDPVGGGNSAMLVTAPGANTVIECYAYFDAAAEPSGENETWALGVHGTTGGYFNTPDPGGTFGFTANGNTGVSIVYQNTDTGGTLYLVDHGNGGWGSGAMDAAVVLGQMSIQTGVNDGWQRVRLAVGEGYAELMFGGTYGAGDGTRIGGRTAYVSEGGVYVGYREFLSTNSTARPPTFDLMIVRDGIGDLQFRGVATPHTTGTPSVVGSSRPDIGNQSFSIDFANLSTNGPTLATIGLAELSPPLNLEPFGAQPGSRAYVNSNVSLTLTPSGGGSASIPLAIPGRNGLIGRSLFVQAIDVDTALSYSLPIAQTELMEIIIGS